MPHIKQQITKNFSNNSERYDQYARIQKYAAGHLCSYLEQLVIEPENKILEIGCGTGFVSEKLIKRFPDCCVIITDISEDMLVKCRDNLLNSGLNLDKVEFQVLDGETINNFGHYEIIISGLTVQWFEDLPGWIERAIGSMKANSKLIFSYLSDKSFPEWRDSCKQLDIPFTGNNLPEHNLLGKISRYKNIHCMWESEFKTENYDSILHFFSELKFIGASTRLTENEKGSSLATLRKLNHFHSNGRGCEISHHLVYGLITF
ncbi:MAG: methyltransferase domain-containing protein [Balneolales bacterium]